MIILAILFSCLFLISLYIFCLGGRTGHSRLPELRNFVYAHRGLHNENRPENSMAAFRAAWEHGYGVELDIHLMKDGNLAVIHDSSLLRVAGADVAIEDLKAGTVEVFDTAKFTVEGAAATGDAVINGIFEESSTQSAPYFELKIDGITRLNEKF